MDDRLVDREPWRVFPKTIEAKCFNSVRLALQRIARPLRIALSDHRGLEVILDDNDWLVVDSVAGDMPILLWCDFKSNDRDNLHKPIACQIRLYHSHAGLIMGTALEALDRAVTEVLSQARAK
ncbi:MAG: hypothetical protein JSW09_04675 [Pseudomonadota bacterium]|nr:MAG: hypothetical protein JSW09_04675 [Pseudomonadota bacterium]